VKSFAATLGVIGIVALPHSAAAEFRVRPPTVETGEVAIEHNGSYAFDPSPSKRGEQSYTLELEFAVTNFWLTEIEGEGGRDPGPDNRTRFTALTWENTFQLTEPGEYWADIGFFAEYSHALPNVGADSITVGPILSKLIGPTLNTFNLFIEKEVGAHAAGQSQVNFAWQTRLLIHPLIEPGFEIFSQPGPLGQFASLPMQDHRAGPVLYGTIRDIGPGKLNYQMGYLFGLTRAAPQGTVKWQVEYELRF
jgi:hypothetical protein